MLKHLAAITLGFAVLFGAIGPAAAYKGRDFWVYTYPSPYLDNYSDRSRGYTSRKSPSQPNVKLDFKTEAVWRNLRPEWFD